MSLTRTVGLRASARRVAAKAAAHNRNSRLESMLDSTARLVLRRLDVPKSDDQDTAARYIPPRPTIKKLQIVAAGCQACHLWKVGTQTVFGEGEQSSTVMFVG